jgi:hypothetical protein
MARLAAELLEAELMVIDGDERVGPATRLASLAPRRRGSEACLVIAAEPRNLWAILRVEQWLHGYGYVAAWVIDAFWDDRIPLAARKRGHFDHFFVTEQEVVDSWRATTETPTSWLPFGSNVLDMGSDAADRPVDLQRFGRMPGTWDDDEAAGAACAAAGLRFEGRPPFLADALANQRLAMARFAQAKFTLSFTNRVSPAGYTHPTREYLTGRWTDALASGATVAGVPPDCGSARELLWPEATLDLGTVDRAEGINRVQKAVGEWHPEVARLNHLRALQRLDWRWRFREVATTMGVSAQRLDAEFGRLRDAIDAGTSAIGEPDALGPGA